MPSKMFSCEEVPTVKNWFSLKLYLEGLKKIKTPGIAAAITVIALNAIIPVIGIVESSMTWPGQVRTMTTVPVAGFAPFNLLMMVFGAILVYSMFSYMNERNKSDFWHAIPQKRTCVYISLMASILTWVLGIILASSLVNLILWAIAKYYIVSASTVFVSVAVYFLEATMMAGFMMISMTITGTTIANLLIMALLMLFVRVMGSIFVMCLTDIAPMLDISYSLWRIFEFDFCLPYALLENLFSNDVGAFGDIPLLMYSLGVTVVVLIAGAVGYVKRKSETATKSAPNKVLQHVYRCAVTLPLVFFLAALLVMGDAEISTTIVLIILTVVVWALFELMTTKKFKNVIKSLPVLVVPVVISILLSGVAFLARNAIWSETPDADEIEGISIGTSSYGTKTYEQIKIDDLVVGNDAINTIVSETLRETVENAKETGKSYVSYSRHIVIHLKSGKTIGRYISMDDKQYMLVRNGFYESAAYRNAFLSLPTSSQIHDVSFSNLNTSSNTEKRLWASFLYEYSMLSDDEKRVVKEYSSGDYYTESVEMFEEKGMTVESAKRYRVVGYAYVNGTVGIESFQSNYPILYEYMPETAKLYLEIYNEVNYTLAVGAEKEIAKIYELACQSLADPDSRLYGSLLLRPMCGNAGIATVDIDFYSGKQESRQFLVDILASLNELSAPEDYEYKKGKTVLFCNLNVEVDGKFLAEHDVLDDSMIIRYEEDVSYYYSMSIPLALTEEEISRVMEIYEKFTVEKTPVE